MSGIEPSDRVSEARRRKEGQLRSMCERAGLTYPPAKIFIRAFKQERELEVWAASDAKSKMVLLRTYPIAAASGVLGPKRREGDRQVPEGCYRIDRFNPQSAYHLSLRLDYPNASDRIFSDPDHPGGDIYIHGSNVSIGCLAMTDDKIEEIYLLALGGKRLGVPVHVYPARLGPKVLARLVKAADEQTAHLWRDLAAIFRKFETTHVVPDVVVDKSGRYGIR